MNQRLCWKIFNKNKYISIAVLGIFAVMLYKPIKETGYYMTDYPNKAINRITSSFLSVCLLWFSLISFITTYLIREIKQTAKEVLWFSAKHSVYKDVFAFSAAINALVSFLAGAYQVVLYFLYGKSHTEYLLRTLADIFFYYFIAGIIAILISLAVSFVKSEIVSVVLLLAVIISVSPLPNALAESFWDLDGKALPIYYKIRKLFEIMPQNMQYTMDFGVGKHVSLFTIGLMFIWLSGLTLLLLYLLGYRRKACNAALFIPLLLGIYIVSMPYVERFEAITHEHDMYGLMYYYDELDSKKEISVSESSNSDELLSAGFSVEKYEMDIKTQWELNNSVRMTLDKPDLESYDFTLAHSYKILSVTDGGGKKLDFTRSGDNFSVSGTGNLTCIVVKYKGNAAPCLSDFESVRLYAGFPWYPYPGKQSLIDVKDFEDIGYDAENHDIKYSPCVNYVSEYDVSIESDYDIYSNLSGNSEGSRGKTDLLTLHGGMIKEDIEGNIHYIYPIELEYDCLLDDGADTWKQKVNEEMEKAGLSVKTDEDYYIVFGGMYAFGVAGGCIYVSGSNVFMYNWS